MSEDGKIIDLVAERMARSPHMQGQVRCLGCRYEWRAVAPVGTCELECPSCKLPRGVWMYPFSLPDGEAIWRCTCGGELFVLTETTPMCATCGLSQTWEPVYKEFE